MKKVFVYVHTHWDREWYREFEEFRLRLIEVVDDIINKLESDEIPSFYFDGQTSALEDYLEIYPNKKETIEKLIKQMEKRFPDYIKFEDGERNQYKTDIDENPRCYFDIKKTAKTQTNNAYPK